MGKMGNKRKASLIVLSVMVAAAALFAGAVDIFRAWSSRSNQNTTVSAATYSWTGTANSNNYVSGYKMLDPSTYLVIMAGQDGYYSGSSSYSSKVTRGYGAVTWTTVSFTATTQYSYAIGKDYGPYSDSSALGCELAYHDSMYAGGYTSFGTFYGAAGGAAVYKNSSSSSVDSRYANATYAPRYNYSYEGCYASIIGYNAVTTNSYSNGYRGFTYEAFLGDAGVGGASPDDNFCGSFSGSNSSTKYVYGGASINNTIGTSSTLRISPLYSDDSVLGAKSTGYGYIQVYNIKPTVFPTVSGGTINAPSSLGSGVYSISSANADLGKYITASWGYSKDGGYSWTTNPADVQLTSQGERDIICAYAVYPVSDAYTGTTGSGSNLKYYPGYGMGNISMPTAMYNRFITRTTLHQKMGQATMVAPTAKTGLVYDGTEKQLLATAGSATNGSMRYSLNNTTDWKTNWTDIKATNPGSYTVYYYAVGNTGYVNTPISSLTVTISGGSAGFSTAPPVGRANLIYNTGPQQLLDTGGGTPSNGTLKYKLSTEDESKWTDDYTMVVATDAGTYIIQYKVFGNAYYDDTETRQIDVTIKQAQTTFDEDPTVNEDLTYTGGAVGLLATAGSATAGGILQYRLPDYSTAWATNIADITAVDPGTYAIEYRVNVSDAKNYYADTAIRNLTVTIGAGNQTLDNGDLAGRDLTYTGSAQTLFTGAASLTAPGNKTGTLYYGVTTSADTEPTTESTNLAALTATDAYNEADEQIVYYLWYRVGANAYTEELNYTNAIEWTLTTITVTIKKATYDVTAVINPNVVYDGKSHQVFNGSPVVHSVTAPNSLVKVLYKLTYTGNNGLVVEYEETTTPNETLNSVVHAGEYLLSVRWAGDTNIVAGSKDLGTFTITKTDITSGVVVSGLPYKRIDELQDTGLCYPFTSDTINIQLTVFGVATYNGISYDRANLLDKDLNPKDYNKLGFVLVKLEDVGTLPTAPANGYAYYDTFEELNAALADVVINSTGDYCLWFKVKKHNSLEDGATFLGAQFRVEGVSAAAVKLTGIIMTGANVEKESGVVTYNTQPYKIIQSGEGARTVQENISLGETRYAVSTSSNYSVRESLTWVSFKEICEETRTNAGTYFLWVQWNASDTIGSSAGVIYAHLEIQQLVVEQNANFHFSGVDPDSTWKHGNRDNSFENYSQVFTNSDHLITSHSLIAQIKAYTNAGHEIPAKDLNEYGNLTVGVSTSLETMNGVYYNDFSKVVVKNAESYYLWIRWPGSANISAGEAVYRICIVEEENDSNKKILTLRFTIEQLSEEDLDDDTIALADIDFVEYVNNSKQQEYKYNFVLVDSNHGSSQGVAQPLFTAVRAPRIKIGGVDYNQPTVTYQYMLSTDNENVKPGTEKSDTNSGWVDTIDQAMMTDVATYYLWVKITINDTNIKLVVTRLVKDAEIIVAEAFVRIAPKAKSNLSFQSGQHQALITASGQDIPKVEYAVRKATDNSSIDTGDEVDDSDDSSNPQTWYWSDNANDQRLCPIDAGVYYVYYRGQAYNNKFQTQNEPVGGYPYLIVEIVKVNGNINREDMPKAAEGLVYTGKPIKVETIFTQGWANAAGINDIRLVYRWNFMEGDEDDDGYVLYENLPTLIDAGFYTLYFKPDVTDPKAGNNLTEDNVEISTITIQIAKANIKISTGILADRELVYAATDYSVILNPVDYGMTEANDTTNKFLTNEDGLALTYGNYTKSQAGTLDKEWTGGKMGEILYAVSTSETLFPTNDNDWKANFREVKIRQAGSYYLWVRVKEGDNHLSLAPECYNISSPIKIARAKSEAINLENSTYAAQKSLKYDGVGHVLLDGQVNLVIKVASRDDNGLLVRDDDGNIVYSAMNNDYLGKVYYAVRESATDFPDEKDFTSEYGWKANYSTLSRVNAGKYYLMVMIVADDNSNFETIKVCLSELATADATQRDELHIDQATWEDIVLSGISGVTKMYTGEKQTLAVGTLSAMHKTSRYNITDQIKDAQYFYTRLGDDRMSEEAKPDVDAEWTAFNSTMVTMVGKYQLWVYLTVTSNIDSTTVPLIYSLLSTGEEDGKNSSLGEITRADVNSVNVIAPTLQQGLYYNGTFQSLISGPAKLEMKNGKSSEWGSLGTAYYYISTSATSIVKGWTEHGGEQEDKNGYENIYNDLLKEKLAGTYYIWVEFAEGHSHEAIDAVYVGAVTIAQATDKNIMLSGDIFTNGTYNGEDHYLISGAIKQTFTDKDGKDTGVELNATDDYEKVQYAYSTAPDVAPLGGWVDNYSDLKAVDAGKYYIWIKVTGRVNEATKMKNVADFMKCYSDSDYSVIVQFTLRNDRIDDVRFHDGLVYIGRNQVLASLVEDKVTILSDQGVNLNTEKLNSDLVIYWGLGTADQAPTDWSLNLKEIQAMNRGTYYLWIWVPETKNIYEYKKPLASITIDKATIVFKEAPKAYENLVYNGSNQILLSDGTVAYFYAEGDYYKENYFLADIVVRYSLNNTTLFYDNYRNIVAVDADDYEIYYGVAADSSDYQNWDRTYHLTPLTVTISPADASTAYIGLTEAPKAVVDLAYKEDENYQAVEQNLISYGVLTKGLPAGVGAALEGCSIVFRYVNEQGSPIDDSTYEYYYDVGGYTWKGDKLPGRKNAGTYYIQYYVTGSVLPYKNFTASEPVTITIKIAPRQVWWDVRPEPVYGVKFVGSEQVAVVPGQLNIGQTDPSKSSGVHVKYTFDDPTVENRTWLYENETPKVDKPGLWRIWYYVWCDGNNEFVGANNDEKTGTMLVVMVERYILTIRQLPQTSYLHYTGEYQQLISYAALSTDNVDTFGNEKPYFEFSFNGVDGWKTIEEFIAKDRKEGGYTVYYRIHYNKDIFEFKGENDGLITPMMLTVEIDAMYISMDSVRAVLKTDEDGNKYITYEIGTVLDEKTEENVPAYSQKFVDEFKGNISYFYRQNDEYNQDSVWNSLTGRKDGDKLYVNIGDLGLGTFEFMLTINGSTNFYNYTQYGIYHDFDLYTVVEDRIIKVIMQDYTTTAYVRAWIDFTGTMLFEESKFSFEGYIEGGEMEIPFYDVNSTGRYGSASIRLQTINPNYYYLTATPLDTKDKNEIELRTADVKNAIKSFYTGLTKKSIMPIYLYEVYHIEYDANGALADSGTVPAEGWKWHGIDYKLAENNLTKGNLTPNGWNTTKAGNGNNYSTGSMYYKDNVSRIFYANFFTAEDESFVIEWRIYRNGTLYALSRDTGVWFDTAAYESRDTGVRVKAGEIITLPNLTDVDSAGKLSLSQIFGGYVKGWYIAEDKDNPVATDTPYFAGMKATRSYIFVADLNDDIKDYIQVKFRNADGEEVHDSGSIANGASAYMALSGMDINTIKTYSEGFNDWVDKHKFDYLHGTSDTPIIYDLGTKTVLPDDDYDDGDEDAGTPMSEYITMLVILGLGVIATMSSLGVYIVMRKKRLAQ